MKSNNPTGLSSSNEPDLHFRGTCSESQMSHWIPWLRLFWGICQSCRADTVLKLAWRDCGKPSTIYIRAMSVWTKIQTQGFTTPHCLVNVSSNEE